MKIVVWVHVPAYREAVLKRIGGVPGVQLLVVEKAEEVHSALEGAEGFISNGASTYTPELERSIRENTTLRWFQSVSAGNDNLEKLGIRDGVVVTGSGGHSGPIVAEHAVALLLSIAHAIPDWERGRFAKVWKLPRTGSYRSLYRGTAVVVGLGHIGSEIARRVKAFEMTVLGVSRSGGGGPDVDEAYSISDLDKALARADAVLIAAPLTADTKGLFNRDRLEACKRGAFLVNVARGGLIDQPALIEALESGHLGGAAIDVTDPEPLPAGDPLWEAPNLIITPHVAGSGSKESLRRLGDTVAANLNAFMNGGDFVSRLPYGSP
jgi:phosphoglycerate dehydrogenase-like enzyme